MLRKIASTFISTTAIVLLVGAPALIQAQTAEDQPKGHEHMHGHMESGEAPGDTDIASRCQQMMSRMKDMHAMMEKNQAELDGLVAVISSTTGDTQQSAMAELLTKLVAQRGHMGSMMQMQSGMMQQMASGDMSGCPMMRKMHGSEGAEAPSTKDDEHSQHHGSQ